MLDDLRCACDAPGCDRALGDDQLLVRMVTAAGERRAYECACGAVTVTVVR
ncbi:hypothetical protein [Halorussus marinus]|uniref:hypothetical protein n=1 Tax=Halorussus marinus TaxID=2505976 RepID=UPI0014316214|nr:hypothetical protein [Halorussus marinus]